jgi:hypothetical protein
METYIRLWTESESKIPLRRFLTELIWENEKYIESLPFGYFRDEQTELFLIAKSGIARFLSTN